MGCPGRKPLRGDVAGRLPVVQSLVPVVLEDGEVARGDDARVARRGRQLAVVGGELRPDVETSLVLGEIGELVGNLRPPCLHREIRLPERDDLFGRVGVLDDKVAGLAREVYIFNLSR